MAYIIKLKRSTGTISVKHIRRDVVLQHTGKRGLQGEPGVGIEIGGTTGQILRKASDVDYDTEWATAAGTGDMLAATYDPQNKSADAFARANHTGSQAISTVTNLQSSLDGKQASDADLTAIAALDSSTAGAIASDGAGWIKKTYAQLKTALGLVKADVGLGNADNTSDANKPVSTAQATADATVASNAASALSAHEADSTNVHGIANTAVLETTSGAQAKADAKVADAINDGTTTIAPSQNAVFDALALKAADADVVHDTGNETVGGVKTFSSDPIIPDEAYDATAWNGSLEPPTKNAVRDKIETMSGGGGQVDSVVAGTGIDVDATDPVNPEVALDSASQASLALADSATQPGDLATVATTGDYDDLIDKPTIPTTKNSVEVDAGAYQLVGDEAAPGNQQYYGTDGGGTKGFHAIPTGGAVEWGDIGGTLSDQTDLQGELDDKVDANAGITGATKTKITYDAKGLVTAGADATTADIADSADKRYITDAQQTVLGNTSGVNTGDQTLPVKATGAEIDTGTDDAKFATPKAIEDSSYIKAAYADALVIDSIADADTTHAPSRNAVFDALALKSPLASPTFTGTPAAPTAAAATNTTQLATTAHVFAERSNNATLTNKVIDGDDNTVQDLDDGVFKSTADVLKRVIRVVLDGGGSAITTGAKKVYVSVPYNCTITSWRLLADQSGSIVLDIWKDTYANFAPTVADTITASAKPTLSSVQKNESSALTGWTTTLAAGDVIEINVDSATTVTKVSLDLFVRVT